MLCDLLNPNFYGVPMVLIFFYFDRKIYYFAYVFCPFSIFFILFIFVKVYIT